MGSSPEGSLRVLALVPYPRDRAPGQRYLIEQWEPVLAEHGIQLTFEPFLSGRGMEVLHRPGIFLTKILEVLRGHVRRLLFARGVAGFDIVFVYREASLLGPAWLERRASSLSRLVVEEAARQPRAFVYAYPNERSIGIARRIGFREKADRHLLSRRQSAKRVRIGFRNLVSRFRLQLRRASIDVLGKGAQRTSASSWSSPRYC